nr:multiple epidermal growth factor-like domains protein 10 [Crassostrea gigas]
MSAAGGQCVISSNNDQTAEWRVDLGEVLSIHHIFIQYRTENIVWDATNPFSGDFLGYSVYVSNSTNKDNGVLCFEDTNYNRFIMPNPTNITCITQGRYVIYYNNRTNPPYPDLYSISANNDLCEVEVYGCPTPGYYGEDCSFPCPQNCQEGHCHIVNGTCLGCVDGYRGTTCNEQCLNQTYGTECQQMCGNCNNEEPCNPVNGSCLNGCNRGWYGEKCNLVCPEGWYGSSCRGECSINCGVPYRCDRVTGQCEGGCQVGWKGIKCDLQCGDGKFGQNCSSLCGHCHDKEQCHYINCTCFNGCDDGYQGSDCTQEFKSASGDHAPTFQSSTTLYVFVTIIVLSVLLNVVLVIRQLRKSMCTCLQQKTKENVDKHFDESIINSEKTNPVYDQEYHNAAYQELGELSKKSQYDKLS